MRTRLPFPLRGFDADNDSPFLNETVLEYCRQSRIEFTRSWQERGVRPTHRKNVAVRDWRTRPDPFEAVLPQVLNGLEEQPDSQAKDLFLRRQAKFPDTFPNGQLRTLQWRVQQW
jgi:hypothetical protein